MSYINHSDTSRRAFLRHAAQFGIAGVAAPWAMNLASIGTAAAQTTLTDYKALVCVFLYGGNDFANTVIPYDLSSHNAYTTLRAGIFTPRSALANTILSPTTALANSQQFAFAPELSNLSSLFNSGKLAVQLNVGPLIQPTTLQQFNNNAVPLPPKLFSHNDQQSLWQSSLPEGSTSGWGGRMGDLFMANNMQNVFSCISATGTAVYLAGQNAVQYQVGTNGAVAINGVKNALYGSTAAQNALRSLLSTTPSGGLENAYATVAKRSIDAEVNLSAAMSAQPALTTVFDSTNSLANQLKTVARIIATRNTLGAKRQVFMVSLGGFDLHDNLLTQHPGLLTQINNAMQSFYDATVELGVANQVTTFTASDFGRTYASNGDGSDHGWGAHHLVMGGAVNGKAFYGTPPIIAASSSDSVGQGRLLPSTSVDQFAGTMASWMGVSNSNMATVLPNLSHFNTTNLGFV